MIFRAFNSVFDVVANLYGAVVSRRAAADRHRAAGLPAVYWC